MRLGHLGLGEGLLLVGRLGVGLGLGLGTRRLALLPRLLGDRARMRVGVGVLTEDVPGFPPLRLRGVLLRPRLLLLRVRVGVGVRVSWGWG